jgi:hypothetical protein
MLRNLDAAWEIRGGRSVVGFFIVDERGGAPVSAWNQFVSETVVPDVLEASLPHRSEAERDAIARAFLGVTTWQAVCREFDIPFGELPHELHLQTEAIEARQIRGAT